MGSLTHRRPPAASTDAQAALDALRRIVQALRASGVQAQHDTGLSGPQFFVLRQLVEEPLSINALAERTHTHQSSVSAVVQRLELNGLVERRTSANDRRKVEASLTPRGRRLVLRSPRVAQDALLEALGALSAKARAGLANGLTQLADSCALSTSPKRSGDDDASVRRAPR